MVGTDGGWSVGEVARLASVTVRTLHHYDELGLLVPSGRTASGHRRYEEADLERLQRVRFYRELGFGLDEVAVLLDGSDRDPLDQLRLQHRLLVERGERLAAMADAVAAAIRAHESGVRLTPEEMFEVFGDVDPTQYGDEVRERWGETEAYRESTRRTATYTKADWARVSAEGAAVEQAFADALAAGRPPTSPEAMAAAEEHRRQIDRNFYPCSYPMQRALAEMYVADERFTKHYEDVAPGLAAYVHDAIVANADRAEG
jgi:MerR family transcriptional regulator, thiopeptide resistance regulator